MRIHCPKCTEDIAPGDVNAQQGIAVCRRCSEVFSLKTLLGEDPSDPPRAGKPESTRVEFTRGEGHVAAILPRGGEKGVGCFMLFFALFWNGITWTMFVALLSEVVENPETGFGVLFMLPFIIIGAAVALAALWLLYGRTSIAMDRETLLLRRELFGRAYTRRWAVADIARIDVAVAYQQNYQPKHGVGVFIAGKSMPVVFGSNLTDEERRWLVWELHDAWRSVRPARPGAA